VPLYFAGGIFSYLGKYLAFGGLAAVIFLSGHQSKSLPGKFFSGLYNLYGGTDYLKDMISYSRLFALGMGTGILAMAINEITKFAVDGFGWLGYIAAPFILLIGHLVINLMMSSLSAYVHTSRLQYVEFFTKFFKGGGKAFSPFSWKKKRVDIKW
jgi:V/A-type H+-transporting ATPase subunit I